MTISGITIRGSQGGVNVAVEISTGDAVVDECDIGGAVGTGVWVHEKGSSAVVRKSHVHDCSNNGIQADNASLIVSDCDVNEIKNAGISLSGAVGTIMTARCSHCDTGVLIDSGTRCDVDASDLSSCNGGAASHRGSSLTVRKSHINDNALSGFDIIEAHCTINACEVLRDGHSGITIHTDADCIVRSSQIRDARDCGINVWVRGRVTIEDCNIHGNANFGLQLRDRCTAAVRTSDMINNHRGAYTFAPDCRMTGAGNKY